MYLHNHMPGLKILKVTLIAFARFFYCVTFQMRLQIAGSIKNKVTLDAFVGSSPSDSTRALFVIFTLLAKVGVNLAICQHQMSF